MSEKVIKSTIIVQLKAMIYRVFIKTVVI